MASDVDAQGRREHEEPSAIRTRAVRDLGLMPLTLASSGANGSHGFTNKVARIEQTRCVLASTLGYLFGASTIAGLA